MQKRFFTLISVLCLASLSDARTIAPDEIKQFAAETFRVNFDAAPQNIQQNILQQYTQRVKLSEVLTENFKNDPEFIRLSEKLAFELWSNRISKSINPTDEELKALFEHTRNIKIAPRYRLRHIVILQESFADIMIRQLHEKNGIERDKLFNYFAATHSQDPNTKLRGGNLGWVNATALTRPAAAALRNKETGSIVKIASDNNTWDIVLIDGIEAERPATFPEAKNYLLTKIRTEAIEKEISYILKRAKPITAKSIR